MVIADCGPRLVRITRTIAEARMAEVVGNPVRDVFRRADRQELQSLARFSGARPMRILVLGGSLGAAPLNELLPATTARLVSQGYGDTISVGTRW